MKDEWDIYQYERWEVARDFTDAESGLRGMVMRGGFSWCAYVGVPLGHALAELEDFTFKCHFGITFRSAGGDGHRSEGYYWYGWDYGHHTDAAAFADELPPEMLDKLAALDELRKQIIGKAPKKWTLDEVVEDCLDVLFELKTQLQQANETLAALTARNHSPG